MSWIVVLHPKPEDVAVGVATLTRVGHDVSAMWPDGMPEIGPLRTDPPDASGTPLPKELGIKPGSIVRPLLRSSPEEALLALRSRMRPQQDVHAGTSVGPSRPASFRVSASP